MIQAWDGPGFKELFGVDLPLELGCFELCETDEATIFAVHPGGSGSALWSYVPYDRSYQCIGHVVAVDRSGMEVRRSRKVIAVRYAMVMQALRLHTSARVAL